MKIINKLIFFFCFGLIILFISCDRDQPTCETCYPEIFRCKINGVFWEPYCSPDPPFGCSAIDVQYYSDTKFFMLSCGNSKDNKSFAIVIRKLDYLYNNTIEFRNSGFSDYNNNRDCISYDIDSIMPYKFVVLDYNESKRTIKSEFAFKLLNKCNDTIDITDGHLDVRF